jgi:general secretion pathway protein C
MCHVAKNRLKKTKPLHLHDNHFMRINPHSLWWPRLLTFSLAALAAASTVYWGLRWPAPVSSMPVMAISEEPVLLDVPALARLLGEAAAGPVASASPAAAGRYELTGVVAGPGASGLAVIAIDGNPAKPYRVGSLVADNLFLQSVSRRGAVLATGAASAEPVLTLEIKPPPQ